MDYHWINPVLLELGPLQVRWYGLMYVIGFLLGGQIIKYLATKKFWSLDVKEIDKYITYLIVGMFIGARTFYVFVYNWDYYSENLLELLSVWRGGLSFHGAVVGMCTATYLFAKKHKLHFFQIGDCLAVAGSPGLFFGRMGNFINGELFGRVTDSWVGVIFPGAGPYPRHPSQLYEGFLEGIVLFVVLFLIMRKQKYYGKVSAAFLMGYGVARFIVEFFREPDAQLGYYFGFLTMGQILCILMIPLGLFLMKKSNDLKLKNPLVD